ncbi:bifunctional tRNA (5-methylaminomethyl-2-thiouridine)(34)-methyltransferase MnmD/FAD-dependent 5-carboxymethylaminomethyl-2-thiouridine(34) oxidoreductase MnmC [Simiduia sp. 21SJ11W-1]|uniref:bifunctional tRNA (5-methylaminomethyl-2-thiouridine)(34)-methyltransferase MnmD/FAD-dependent 5-carboxymethylaminomethyl-2-thiouridine(34) oxidoreductase MnmC n=1 Tax=Simiduia sp. 21SJ11W-1 TaxID=2909669 RepID=UPI00209D13F5|nr:bifunctional tRNA (5-methylaminomethyl-2-thiouridine)(34)-methyltransferase MnmD/FAD-dependent 5-carboxymethylaminomethyl-2-thiouridine(34) oxidoreductase MnmC [Simiduia sp. 21SJ11W-1]UTA46594.1 bifunctional tRNA (5-methylaminomethyl-2-thiouridine)(34)-methyltransferase MnmD/FAD-dependent 5-carboxymethylaminomethyl-2-thiouridine(34) oxidoreductase MnmC [Simiduia sp. 21SJ11W-1]
MEKTPPDLHTHTTPGLCWRDGQPFSTAFDDFYFSSTDGLAESRYVFLQHNQLAERWAALTEPAFTIGETGFGTGLNFLAAATLWLATAPASATLHFVSLEKYPLSRAELAQALGLWPELNELAQQLVAAYPHQPEQEIYALSLAGGRVRLTLMIGDAELALRYQIHNQHPQFAHPKMQVDAWFLDGFTPARNPEMWSAALFDTLAALSGPSTTLATFTAASAVRRGLQAAGFNIARHKGFGIKREMLSARFTPSAPNLEKATEPHAITEAKAPIENTIKPVASAEPQPAKTPWALYTQKPVGRSLLVIGAGMAGCHTARAFARRGWQVLVVDAASKPASGASGNAQGVVYAKLSPKRHLAARFNLTALQYALNVYRDFWQANPAHGQACGVLQLAHEKDTPEQHQAALATLPQTFARWLSQAEAAQVAGVDVSGGGTWLPEAGWLDPGVLCQWLLTHPGISTHFNETLHTLTPLARGRWQVTGRQQQWQADAVVIACAHQSLQFEQCKTLPLKAIRGQVTRLPSNNTLAPLRCVLTREGYLAPNYQGLHSLGATFNLGDTRTELCEQDHQSNLQMLAHTLPRHERPQAASLGGRVGFRCTSPDYLPIVGPMPNIEAFTQTYGAMRRNARAAIAQAPGYWPNLFVNLAHGSRGLAYSPLCAELLAAYADSSPWPMHPALAEALNPARFVMRDIARNKR